MNYFILATRFSEVNETVQKKLNELKEFPDFLEVVEWITEANNESELSLR
jgi:predicted house-cleaning noncanonical NTP pyrophosphatase (MazG superfamily)